MLWHTELGFKEYPLDPRSNPNMVGVMDIEKELKEYIAQGNMCLLCGFTGSGKTSMLERLQLDNGLTKDHNFIYLSADGLGKDFNIDKAIKKSRSFFNKLVFKKAKNLVIMLDECHLANRNLTEAIKSKWNFRYENGDKLIKSVVVSQIDDNLGTNFSGSFRDRLGRRLVKMKRLDYDDMVKVLKTRLDNGKYNFVNKFDEEGLNLLIKSSDGSVRQMLEYTDAIFRYHFNMEDNPILKDKDYKVSKETVFNILSASRLAVTEEKNYGPSEDSSVEDIFSSKRMSTAIEVINEHGVINSAELAKELKVSEANARQILYKLKQEDAIVLSHEKGKVKYWVLAPRIKHEIVKE